MVVLVVPVVDDVPVVEVAVPVVSVEVAPVVVPPVDIVSVVVIVPVFVIEVSVDVAMPVSVVVVAIVSVVAVSVVAFVFVSLLQANPNSVRPAIVSAATYFFISFPLLPEWLIAKPSESADIALRVPALTSSPSSECDGASLELSSKRFEAAARKARSPAYMKSNTGAREEGHRVSGPPGHQAVGDSVTR